MTTVNIRSQMDLEAIRKADAVKKVKKAVMAVISGNWLKQMLRTHRSRRQLAQLSDHLLADIGLTEAQRQAELRKPFWKSQWPAAKEKAAG